MLLETAALVTAVTVIGSAITWVLVRTRRRYVQAKIWFTKLNEAVEQLRPNGGSSIKDSICRIDNLIQRNTAALVAMQLYDPRCLFECDINGRCTMANKNLCELFGLDTHDMLGSGWLLSLLETDRARVWDIWIGAVKAGIPYEATYTVVNRRTHQHVLCIAYASPLLNSKKELLGYSGVITEIGVVTDN